MQALEPISLDIAENAFVCLLGPSGCGKTTLLNILAGFETATSGRVMMDGRPVRGPDPRRGVVFQQGALFTWMSVLDNVAFGPLATGKSQAEARRIAGAVPRDGRSDRRSRSAIRTSFRAACSSASGIARALANEPEILLMDEPFAALDAQTRELLQEEIKRDLAEHPQDGPLDHAQHRGSAVPATDIVVMSARPGRIKARFRPQFAAERGSGGRRRARNSCG